MSSKENKMLLIGDNPFHGISHLSQERARDRISDNELPSSEYAANIVISSLENGANGFMFSVSETTLSILRKIHDMRCMRLKLYAIIPYAFEYVRLATQIGIHGLATRFVKNLVVSRNIEAIALGLKGIVRADPLALLKTFLTYEVSRIKSANKQSDIVSILLHEVITDMALALNLDWLLKSYWEFITDLGIKPGFNTRNFPYLVKKFSEWNIDLSKTIIATPFNKVGFQMNPSQTECEKTLKNLPESNIIAISILAAGYLSPSEALDYIQTLSELKGVVVGISKEQHALTTFRVFENLFH